MVAISESASAADSVTTQISLTRPLTDYTHTDPYSDIYGDTYSTLPADAVTHSTGTFLRAIAEAATASDALSQALTATRTVSDAAPAADALLTAATYLRQTAEAAPASDTLLRGVLTLVAAVFDAAASGDNPTVVLSVARAAADIAASSDSVAQAQTDARLVGETAHAVDALIRVVAFARAISDSAPSGTTVEDVVDLANWAIRIAGSLRAAFAAQRPVTAWSAGELFVAGTLDRAETPTRHS